MHFSTIVLPVVLFASSVFASPIIEERSSGVSAVANAVRPQWKSAEVAVHGSAASHVGAAGITSAVGVSKREDYNELAERQTTPATFVACTASNCGGTCYGYSLPVNNNVCYGIVSYNSLYVYQSNNVGLNYGVYAGTNCNGVLIPYVNTCYNISPTANTFFIRA